jgi:site-specific DNA-methyltransferase (adenine-specific)
MQDVILFMNFNNQILCGDALEVLKTLPDKLVQSVITSPPYWALRDYGVDGQLGLEKDFNEYIVKLCNIFDEVKRVLKDDGVVFVNLGDTYSGSGKGAGSDGSQKESWTWTEKVERVCSHCNKKFIGRKFQNFCSSACSGVDNTTRADKNLLPNKSLCQIPSRFAIEMSNRGWILRNEIIWYKPSCLPASVKDRFTVDFEKIFFFTKKTNYLFNQQFEKVSQSTLKDTRPHGVLRQKMYNGKHVKAGMVKKLDVLPENDFREERNMRTVWAVNNIGIKENHFAAYPEELVKRMLLASTNENDLILDPFFCAGTTGLTARKFNRNYLGIEINPKYIDLANKRLENGLGIFN